MIKIIKNPFWEKEDNVKISKEIEKVKSHIRTHAGLLEPKNKFERMVQEVTDKPDEVIKELEELGLIKYENNWVNLSKIVAEETVE